MSAKNYYFLVSENLSDNNQSEPQSERLNKLGKLFLELNSKTQAQIHYLTISKVQSDSTYEGYLRFSKDRRPQGIIKFLQKKLNEDSFAFMTLKKDGVDNMVNFIRKNADASSFHYKNETASALLTRSETAIKAEKEIKAPLRQMLRRGELPFKSRQIKHEDEGSMDIDDRAAKTDVGVILPQTPSHEDEAIQQGNNMDVDISYNFIVKGGRKNDLILLETDTFWEVYEKFNCLRRLVTTNNISGNTCYYNSTIQIILKIPAFLKYAFRGNVSDHWFRPLLRTLFCGYYLAEYIGEDNFEETIYIPILKQVLKEYKKKYPSAITAYNGHACPADLLAFIINSITEVVDDTDVFGSVTRMVTRECEFCKKSETDCSAVVTCLDTQMSEIPNQMFKVPDGVVIDPSFIFDTYFHARYGDHEDNPCTICQIKCLGKTCVGKTCKTKENLIEPAWRCKTCTESSSWICESCRKETKSKSKKTTAKHSNFNKECEGMCRCMKTTIRSTFSGDIGLIVIPMSRRAGLCITEEKDSKYEIQFKSTQKFTGLTDEYELVGFMVHHEQHLIGFVQVESSWFEVDSNSMRIIGLPDIQMKFAQQAVLAFYVSKSDMKNSDPKESLLGQQIDTVQIVDLEKYETQVRSSLLMTVDYFKSYRHILTSSDLGTSSFKLLCAAARNYFNVSLCSSDDKFFVVHYPTETDENFSEVKELVLSVEKESIDTVDGGVMILEKKEWVEKTVTKSVSVYKEKGDTFLLEPNESFDLVVLVTESNKGPNFWYARKNGKFSLIQDHNTTTKSLRQIMQPKGVVITSVCYVNKIKEASTVHDKVELMFKEIEDTSLVLKFGDIGVNLLKDIPINDYLFTKAGSSDQKIPDEFTLIALMNSTEGIYIREELSKTSTTFWTIDDKVPRVDTVSTTRRNLAKYNTLHIRDRCLHTHDVCKRIDEIVDFGTLTENIKSLCEFFHLDPMRMVAQNNLCTCTETKYLAGALEELKEEDKAVQVFYCKNKTFIPFSKVPELKNSAQSYDLMAYVSISKQGEAQHYVRFDKNTPKFASKELMSPYTIPPHDLSDETKCYILMYIANRQEVNDCIKKSSLENSVSHIAKFFSPIANRLPNSFTDRNLVTVVIDAKGHVVKNPTPDSVINAVNTPIMTPDSVINAKKTPIMFVEIVNRIDTSAKDKDQNYEYQKSIPSNYFIQAIGQLCHKKSQKKGFSCEEKIWWRSDKTKEFQHVRAIGEASLEWSTTETKILKEGVVFVYSMDQTW